MPGYPSDENFAFWKTDLRRGSVERHCNRFHRWRCLGPQYTEAVKSAVFFLLLSWGAGAARRPFTPEDLRAWRTASDARIRPDGRWVVYVERYYEGAVSRSNLWIASTDGKERKRWTEGAWNDSSPRWSPDGERIAWISDRGGTPQIRVRKLDATAEAAIASEAPVLNFAWSADGEAIAFTARVAPKAAAPSWLPPALLPRLRQPEGTAQIFVVAGSGGTARQLSHAETGGRSEPSWTLDAKSVIAACDDAIVSLRASDGAAKVLTKDAGRYESPLVSPDGGRIAYLFTERKPQSYTVRKLWVMNVDGSRARALSGSLDRDAADPQWSSESRTVYFLADDRGATHVYAARNDGTVRQATDKPERLRGFSLADNGRAASVRSSATEGGDVVTFTVDVVSQPVTLAAPNEHLLADREIGPVEEMTYQSDGTEHPGVAGEAGRIRRGPEVSATGGCGGRSAADVRRRVSTARADSGGARFRGAARESARALRAMARSSVICCARAIRATTSTT